MWGKFITREDKENLYNAGDFSITLQERPQVERELVDKLVEQIKAREQYPCILYEFAPRKCCKDQFSFFRHQLNKKKPALGFFATFLSRFDNLDNCRKGISAFEGE